VVQVPPAAGVRQPAAPDEFKPDAARPRPRCWRRWPRTGQRRRVTRTALPQPFVGARDRQPIEYEGTYPLPEAQLTVRHAVRDRYLPAADEVEMLSRRVCRGATEPTVRQVLDRGDAAADRAAVESVSVGTREERPRLRGAHRRGHSRRQGRAGRGKSEGLASAAAAGQGGAMLDRRDYVTRRTSRRSAVARCWPRLSLRPGCGSPDPGRGPFVARL